MKNCVNLCELPAVGLVRWSHGSPTVVPRWSMGETDIRRHPTPATPRPSRPRCCGLHRGRAPVLLAFAFASAKGRPRAGAERCWNLLRFEDFTQCQEVQLPQIKEDECGRVWKSVLSPHLILVVQNFQNYSCSFFHCCTPSFNFLPTFPESKLWWPQQSVSAESQCEAHTWQNFNCQMSGIAYRLSQWFQWSVAVPGTGREGRGTAGSSSHQATGSISPSHGSWSDVVMSKVELHELHLSEKCQRKPGYNGTEWSLEWNQ